MNNIIASYTSNSSQPFANPLLTKNSIPSSINNKSNQQSASLNAVVNKNSSSVASQSNSNLGLYNNKGVIPSQSNSKPVEGNGNFTATGGVVQVDILASDSGYNNKIYWSTDNFKTKHYIGIDNQTGSFVIGNFAAGTQIKFGIDNGVGGFFKTGAAADNPDKIQHAKSVTTASGSLISFEDLLGGGDRDYNDVIFNVKNLGITKNAATTTSKNNNSGLGDGTNPGQGAGKTNSPNTGTNNPNNATSTLINGAALKAQAAVQNSKNVVANPVVKTPEKDAPQVVNNAVKQAQEKLKPSSTIKPAVENVALAQVQAAVIQSKVVVPVKSVVSAPPPKAVAAPKVNAIKDVKITPAQVNNQATTNVKNTSTNRSGLADGTNPGQGAVNTNSNNQGVNNPNNKATTMEAKLLNAYVAKK
jgi:hypothetical protein